MNVEEKKAIIGQAKAVLWARIMSDRIKPHTLAKDLQGRLWEFISYPFPHGDRVLVMARVPGDPTTIQEFDAFALDPEGRACLCNQGGEFYYVDERNIQ